MNDWLIWVGHIEDWKKEINIKMKLLTKFTINIEKALMKLDNIANSNNPYLKEIMEIVRILKEGFK